MTLSVSVVIPTHDRPESLARAVASALTQTLQPHELIVVNDGEADVDGGLARQAVDAGVTMTLLRQDVASATVSRNRGLAEAAGDVVLLIDDDIVLPPDYLVRLVELYEADTAGAVGGIGGVYEASRRLTWPQRVWQVLQTAAGWACWRPRVIAARYVSLPPQLRGRLREPKWLVGGAISLRKSVAATARFNEAFSGYSFSEDREFSFRVGRRHVLLVAPELRVQHERSSVGRPDMRRMGRLYARNSLITASGLGGAGTWMLVAWDLLGTMVLYGLWSLAGSGNGHGQYAAGLVEGLRDQLQPGRHWIDSSGGTS